MEMRNENRVLDPTLRVEPELATSPPETFQSNEDVSSDAMQSVSRICHVRRVLLFCSRSDSRERRDITPAVETVLFGVEVCRERGQSGWRFARGTFDESSNVRRRSKSRSPAVVEFFQTVVAGYCAGAFGIGAH